MVEAAIHPRPPRRSLAGRSAETVDRLLDAGLDVLREQGYDQLSMREVCRRAGLTHATAYGYFSAKQHLVAEAYWRRIRTWCARQVTGDTPTQRLAAVFIEMGDLMAEEPELSLAASAAILGGKVTAGISGYSEYEGQIKSGKLRAIGITSSERRPGIDIPTFKEQGYDVVETLWRGVMVKAGTPKPVIDRLTSAMDKVEANPAWKAFMKSNVQSPLHLSVDQMQHHVAEEVASRRKFLKDIGLEK